MELLMPRHPNAGQAWEVTRKLLDEAGMCGLPPRKRLWRTITGDNHFHIHLLELIAIDAALSEIRNTVNKANEPMALSRLAEIEVDAEEQNRRLQQGLGVVPPWADIDDLRHSVGLEPSTKPYGKR
ncbi:hypothetical protein [Nonomuraea sp. NPDC002799]